MNGGRGLEAVEPRRNYITCRTCHGEGYGEDVAGDPDIPNGIERITVRCDTCGGSGEEYVGPSPEPEDYVDDDGSIDTSPSYRDSMDDAGRGGLLKW